MRAITEPIKQLSAAAMEADLKSWLPIFQERGSIEIVALARALSGRVLEFARPHAGLGRLGSLFVANAIERIFFPNAMAWPAVTIHLPRSISPVRIRLASLTGSPVGLRIWIACQSERTP